ncbi:hypothetical protein C9374_007889 [Naegleria lovaniensis]|uniref:Transmembrane protein n=1 Tax=Naegleria lovaniensis TaxID=51637 RepID=A0AA88GLM9_NAELO|nr:uncharacterized protein C9374_007889 [Naegleria lovaniensis]KAG2378741.1 hypothetical protein C9374_007889 [Naegleria lovaniensis]
MSVTNSIHQLSEAKQQIYYQITALVQLRIDQNNHQQGEPTTHMDSKKVTKDFQFREQVKAFAYRLATKAVLAALCIFLAFTCSWAITLTFSLHPVVCFVISFLLSMSVSVFMSHLEKLHENEEQTLLSTVFNWCVGSAEHLDVIVENFPEVKCPLTLQPIRKPGLLFGHHYEYKTIKQQVELNGTCPLTRKECTVNDIQTDSDFEELLNKFYKSDL